MGFILSLLANPMAALQMIGVGVIALGLGFGGGWIKGYDAAVAKYQVASLKEEVSAWKKASDEKEKILAADGERAQKLEEESTALREKIKDILDATPPVSAACKLSRDQLLKLRTIASQASAG